MTGKTYYSNTSKLSFTFIISGPFQCSLHLSLIYASHITQLSIRILTDRARGRIRPEIKQEQCGSVKDIPMSLTEPHCSGISKDQNVIRTSNINAKGIISMFHRLRKSIYYRTTQESIETVMKI